MGESVREPSETFRCPPLLEVGVNFHRRWRSVATVTFDSSRCLSVVLVAPWIVGLHRNLLVGTADDRIVWLNGLSVPNEIINPVFLLEVIQTTWVPFLMQKN